MTKEDIKKAAERLKGKKGKEEKAEAGKEKEDKIKQLMKEMLEKALRESEEELEEEEEGIERRFVPRRREFFPESSINVPIAAPQAASLEQAVRQAPPFRRGREDEEEGKPAYETKQKYETERPEEGEKKLGIPALEEKEKPWEPAGPGVLPQAPAYLRKELAHELYDTVEKKKIAENLTEIEMHKQFSLYEPKKEKKKAI